MGTQRRRPNPYVLNLSARAVAERFQDLCEGRVPIPGTCADCGAIATLAGHQYDDRTCHLADRGAITVVDVRCLACGATRRILPPFVAPFRRYPVAAMWGWLRWGEPPPAWASPDVVPEGSTMCRWKVATRQIASPGRFSSAILTLAGRFVRPGAGARACRGRSDARETGAEGAGAGTP